MLVEEFTCQGDLERQLGMAVQPMNDRDKLVLEDMQIGFIKFVASSLFEGVASIAHGKMDDIRGRKMLFLITSVRIDIYSRVHTKQSQVMGVQEAMDQ